MLARYQRAVGSIPDSGTSNSEPTGREFAIPALPDLCFGIVSGPSRRLDSSSFLDPRAPARPGLSFTLCVSAGTEPAVAGRYFEPGAFNRRPTGRSAHYV